MNMATDNVDINNTIYLEDRYPAIYQCSICLENFTQDDESDPKKTCETNCFHTFHIKCIKQWAVYGQNCPFCKQYIHSLHPLQFRTEEQYLKLIRNHGIQSISLEELRSKIASSDNIQTQMSLISEYIILIKNIDFINTLSIKIIRQELLDLTNIDNYNGVTLFGANFLLISNIFIEFLNLQHMLYVVKLETRFEQLMKESIDTINFISENEIWNEYQNLSELDTELFTYFYPDLKKLMNEYYYQILACKIINDL